MINKGKDENFPIILLGVLVIILAGFFIFKNPFANSFIKPKITKVTVGLVEENKSYETGTATLEDVDGKTLVTLAMTGTGVPKGVAQPAHIHTGSCPDVKEVVYALTNVVNGKSVTTLDVSLDTLASKLPLGINVHKSAAQSKVYVSCGDLKF